VERHNNFDALRALAASAVILTHAILLATGQLDADPLARVTQGTVTLGVAGVFVFFVVSGYLVTESWERAPSLPRFAAKRGLRIYPALFVCVLLLTFALGPAVTRLALGDYLGAYGTWDFLVANLLLHTDHNSLPGVWLSSGDNGTILNGPLWSLPVEVAMYAMVAGLGLLRAIRLPVLGLLFAIGLICLHYDTTRYYEFIGSVGWMLSFFVAGMVFYKLRAAAWILHPLAAFASLLVLVASAPLGLFLLACPIFGAHLVLFLARYRNFSVLPAARFGDLSYGLYIYGWPVEQTLLYLRPGLDPMMLFAVAWPLTAAIAFLSWHLVEKRALRWKPGSPRVALAAPLQPARAYSK
jgi:peptidoglycan/LPS O-acetylase OafA/YrhL